jgi:hypothetical protein
MSASHLLATVAGVARSWMVGQSLPDLTVEVRQLCAGLERMTDQYRFASRTFSDVPKLCKTRRTAWCLSERAGPVLQCLFRIHVELPANDAETQQGSPELGRVRRGMKAFAGNAPRLRGCAVGADVGNAASYSTRARPAWAHSEATVT